MSLRLLLLFMVFLFIFRTERKNRCEYNFGVGGLEKSDIGMAKETYLRCQCLCVVGVWKAVFLSLVS